MKSKHFSFPFFSRSLNSGLSSAISAQTQYFIVVFEVVVGKAFGCKQNCSTPNQKSPLLFGADVCVVLCVWYMLMQCADDAGDGGYASLVITFLSLNLLFQIKSF